MGLMDQVFFKVGKSYYKKIGVFGLPFILVQFILTICMIPFNLFASIYLFGIKKVRSFLQFSAITSVYAVQTWVLGFILIFAISLLPVFQLNGFNNLYAKFISYYLIIVSISFLLGLLFSPSKTVKSWSITIFNERILFIVTAIVISAVSLLGYVYLLSEGQPIKDSLVSTIKMFFQFESITDFVIARLKQKDYKLSVNTLIYVNGALFYSTIFIGFLKVFKLKKNAIEHEIVFRYLLLSRNYARAGGYLRKYKKQFKQKYYQNKTQLHLSMDEPELALESLKSFVDIQEEDINDVLFIELLSYCFALHTKDYTKIKLLDLASTINLKSYTHSIMKNMIEGQKYYDKIKFESVSTANDSQSFSDMVDRYNEVQEGNDEIKNKFHVIADMQSHSVNQNCVKFYYLLTHAVSYKNHARYHTKFQDILSEIENELSKTLNFTIQRFLSNPPTLLSNFFFIKVYVLGHKQMVVENFNDLNERMKYLDTEYNDKLDNSEHDNFKYLLGYEKLFKDIIGY